MAYVDFKALKQAVRMMDVLAWLKLELTPEGQTLRGECPLCKRGGDRALVCTPSKHLWYCHSEEAGGDTIAFVARMFGCSTKEAAAQIAEHFGFEKGNGSQSHRDSNGSSITKPSAPPQPTDELGKVLERLSHDHEAVQALGLTPDICKALGIGYLAKGTMKQRVAFALRLGDGTLVGFMGLATSPDQAPLLLFPKNLLEKIAPAKDDPKPENVVDFKKFYRA